MATEKSSSAKQGVMIPVDAYNAMMEFMDGMDARQAAVRESERRLAEMEAARQHRENIIGRLTNKDMVAIRLRLDDVLQSCAAIHHIAVDVTCMTDTTAQGRYLKAIEEMARANVKGLDACIELIGGSPNSGLFADELEAVEESD